MPRVSLSLPVRSALARRSSSKICCRRLTRSSFVTAKIVTTQLAGDDLLHLVAAGFGIAKEGLAKGSLLQRISDFALAQQRNGKRVLLIVDEAQNLSFEALEELRMLSNIVFDRTMALQSFLLGQPQFRATLGSPRLEQLRQRVTAAYHLGPLNEAESKAYVEHRLRRADWKGDPHFSEDCFPLIHQRTGGVPRQINTLCSRLLLFGFLEELHTLTASSVQKVANDLREEIASGGGAVSGRRPSCRTRRQSRGLLADYPSPRRAGRQCPQAGARDKARYRDRGELSSRRTAVSTAAKPLQRVASEAVMRRSFDCLPRRISSGPADVRWGVANAMTIDVEDYFQVEAFASTIDRKDWDDLPQRVERNTERMLDILAGVRGSGDLLCAGLDCPAATPAWCGGSLRTGTNWRVTELIMSGLIGCRPKPFAPTCAKASVFSRIPVVCSCAVIALRPFRSAATAAGLTRSC